LGFPLISHQCCRRHHDSDELQIRLTLSLAGMSRRRSPTPTAGSPFGQEDVQWGEEGEQAKCLDEGHAWSGGTWCLILSPTAVNKSGKRTDQPTVDFGGLKVK
jgi:hypothetical protein